MKLKIFLMLLLATCFAAKAAAQARPSLSNDQATRLLAIKANTEKLATPYALELAATAKRIFENMLADKEDKRLRRKLHNDLHRAAGRLLDIKGDSFRDILAMLTPEQKNLVREEIKKPGGASDLSEVVEKLFVIPGK